MKARRLSNAIEAETFSSIIGLHLCWHKCYNTMIIQYLYLSSISFVRCT